MWLKYQQRHHNQALFKNCERSKNVLGWCDVMCSKTWVGLVIQGLKSIEAVILRIDMEICLAALFTKFCRVL